MSSLQYRRAVNPSPPNMTGIPSVIIASQTLATIYVGDSADALGKTFVVHRDLLCYHSPYFAGALQAPFQGPLPAGETQTMYLDDVDSNIFGLLVTWMYCLEIYSAPRPTLKSLALLHGLAARFTIPALQQACIDVLNKGLQSLGEDPQLEKNVKEFIKVVSTLDTGSPIKELLLCKIVKERKCLDWWMGLMSKGLLKDLARALNGKVDEYEEKLEEVHHNCPCIACRGP